MKRTSNLTEDEQKVFCERFYWVCDLPVDDLDTPYPWGCPWEWTDRPLQGNTIEEMADNFFKSIRPSIVYAIDYSLANNEETI